MLRTLRLSAGLLLTVGVMLIPAAVLAADIGEACSATIACDTGLCSGLSTGCYCATDGCRARVTVGGLCTDTEQCRTGLVCDTTGRCNNPPAAPAGRGCTCSCAFTTAGGPVSRAIPLTPTSGSTLAQATGLCQTTCASVATDQSGTSPTQTLACPAGTFPDSASPTPTASDPASGDSGSIALYNPLDTNIGVAEFISRGIRTVIGFVGALALLMFVYGGVMWMTAGDSKRVETSKEILKNSTIGLLLIFFSYSIVSIVFSLLSST